MPYFERQFQEPYRSTVHFCDWLKREGVMEGTRRVLDFGAGMGETLHYMARQFPAVDFLGVDLSETLVAQGANRLAADGIKNAHLECGDIFDRESFKEHRGKYEGIVCLQTLMSLPDFKAPLQGLMSLEPRWIAISTLLYEGDVTARVEIEDYTKPQLGEPCRRELYNIYSFPLMKKFLEERGYFATFERFVIDRDLPRPAHTGMTTYTKKDEHGERMQISGPMLMNWGFVLARRRT